LRRSGAASNKRPPPRAGALSAIAYRDCFAHRCPRDRLGQQRRSRRGLGEAPPAHGGFARIAAGKDTGIIRAAEPPGIPLAEFSPPGQ
ncbi:MAG: hypothetical protein ACREDM_15125, partial [Methylocella sp.]